MELTWDVTIRGAGIFGLSIAYSCAARGARVQVVDPNGVGAGASGGVLGALAPHVPENWNSKKAFQLESLLMADAYWAKVDAASGIASGYGRTGRYQPLADEHAVSLARARCETAAELWPPDIAWSVIDAPGGWGPPSPTGLVVKDTLTARIRPRAALRSLAAACSALGAGLSAEGPDTGAVVWATGWQGLADLGTAFGRTAGAGVKGQAALLAAPAPPAAPQIFADALHIVPHVDGTVAIGSTSERDWDAPDSTDAQLDALVTRARGLVPHLEDAPVVARWAGIRPRAKSRAPQLGPWPGRSGHFIANGGFKIGIGLAPLIGEVMADLVLEGSDRIPAAFGTRAALG